MDMLVRDRFSWHENLPLWSAFAAWALAQAIKLAAHFAKTRKVDFRYFVSTGGMPSAHSCMVSALAMGIGYEFGMSSPLFALAVIFAGVVMFDAQSVRRAAGLQARLLNQMVDELFHDRHISQEKLAELLGHTPVQVFAGMTMGILVATAVRYLAEGSL